MGFSSLSSALWPASQPRNKCVCQRYRAEPLPSRPCPVHNNIPSAVLTPKVKDTTGILPVCPFRTFEELQSVLLSASVDLGPRDSGTLALIVLRPTVNERLVVQEAHATGKHGVHGSGWRETSEKGLTDQVCVMSTSAIKAIASEDPATWPPAGDQLFCTCVGCDVRRFALHASATNLKHISLEGRKN
jgi:hypothetical protein